MVEETALTALEHRALLSALVTIQSEQLRDCLLKQVWALSVAFRQDDRPYGFYTYFTFRDGTPSSLTDEEVNRNPPVTWGIYGDRRNPISFVVYVKNGLIDFLEASSTISEWPEHEEAIEFSAE